MTDEELQKLAAEEIAALEESGAGLPFIFRPSEAYTLLSLLQLALRHPAIQDAEEVAAFARRLARNIEERMGKDHPGLMEMARRGWLVEYDIYTGGHPHQ